MKKLLWLGALCLVFTQLALCQTLPANVSNWVQGTGLWDRLSIKVAAIGNSLDTATQSLMTNLQKKEIRLYKKLARRDSAKAREIFGTPEKIYTRYRAQLNDTGLIQSRLPVGYLSSLDSISVALRLQHVALKGGPFTSDIVQSIGSIEGLQKKFARTEIVRQQMAERIAILQTRLKSIGWANKMSCIHDAFKDYKKKYADIRQMANHPEQALAKLVSVVRSQKIFANFFRKYSFIKELLPRQSYIDQVVDMGTSSLQTRSMVTGSIADYITNPSQLGNVLQQNAGALDQDLSEVCKRLQQLGATPMPEDLDASKPSAPPSKSLFKNLKFGFNAQNAQGSQLLPATTDWGLSLGYKFAKTGEVGIGSAYKMGWGKSIRQLNISTQGVGLRSYIEYKFKWIIYGAGGYEYNYQPIAGAEHIPGIDSWSKSGLLGLSLHSPIKKGAASKSKVTVLWDFLASQQLPRTPSFKIRFGCNISKK